MMLRSHELQQNPVSVTLRDENGAMLRDKSGEIIRVVAERLKRGIVKMTCRCQDYSRAGWCRHCLAVFADPKVFEDDKHQNAFEQLVRGTYLEAAAAKFIQTLEDFSVAYTQMKSVLPAGIDPDQLTAFATQADYASNSAKDLALALREFTKQVAADVRVREDAPDAATASLSRLKRKALRMIRKALMEGREEHRA